MKLKENFLNMKMFYQFGLMMIMIEILKKKKKKKGIAEYGKEINKEIKYLGDKIPIMKEL